MTTPAAPIFLIGYRGTGKSAVARELADRLNRSFLDADEEIERRAGKSIAAMFAEDGEEPFRELEAQVVADMCSKSNAVISLGGGAVLREENRGAITAAGPVVWLTASVETIAARIAADETTTSRRPNLTATGGRVEIEAVLAARTPIYRACATFVIDTDDRTPADVADGIVAEL